MSEWIERDSGWFEHPEYGKVTYEPRVRHGREGWYRWTNKRRVAAGPYETSEDAKLAAAIHNREREP